MKQSFFFRLNLTCNYVYTYVDDRKRDRARKKDKGDEFRWKNNMKI